MLANRTRRSALPMLDWLSDYQKDWLRPDIIAGLTKFFFASTVGVFGGTIVTFVGWKIFETA